MSDEIDVIDPQNAIEIEERDIIFGDSESATKYFVDKGRRIAKNPEFEVRKAQIIKLVSEMDAIFTIRAVYGENVSKPVDLQDDPRFVRILDFFKKTDAFAAELFRPTLLEEAERGGTIDPDSQEYADALKLASLGAVKAAITFFGKVGETKSQTIERLHKALKYVGPQVRPLIDSKKVTLAGGDLEETGMDQEEFILFVHLVFRGPNSGWKTAILERTARGEDVDKKTEGIQLAITKDNVGTFAHMIAEKKKHGDEWAVVEVQKDIDEFSRLIHAESMTASDVETILTQVIDTEKGYWQKVLEKIQAKARVTKRATYSSFAIPIPIALKDDPRS